MVGSTLSGGCFYRKQDARNHLLSRIVDLLDNPDSFFYRKSLKREKEIA